MFRKSKKKTFNINFPRHLPTTASGNITTVYQLLVRVNKRNLLNIWANDGRIVDYAEGPKCTILIEGCFNNGHGLPVLRTLDYWSKCRIMIHLLGCFNRLELGTQDSSSLVHSSLNFRPIFDSRQRCKYWSMERRFDAVSEHNEFTGVF